MKAHPARTLLHNRPESLLITLLLSLLISGAPAVTNCASQSCSGATLVMFSAENLDYRPPHSNIAERSGHHLRTDVSAAQLAQLSTHDIVLLIDKSHSMATKDCSSVSSDPAMFLSDLDPNLNPVVSRWQWCHEQTTDLTEQTHGAMPAGITVVLFSNSAVEYNHVDAQGIETIFSDNLPKGGTNTADALKGQLDQYFERRVQLGPEAKPLLIAVITDGCPDYPTKLSGTIIDATRQMTMPGEITITFLQVGRDLNGSRLLNDLDSGLVDRKAKFDIVDVKPFAEVSRTGLTQALINAVAQR